MTEEGIEMGAVLTDSSAVDLPRDKLAALLRVSDEISERIFHADGEAKTLQLVARHVHELLRAECCGIFLAPWGRWDTIALKAVSVDEGRELAAPDPQPIPVVIEPGRGLTGALAADGQLRRMNRGEIYGNPYHSKRRADFLPSGTCYSLLAIPLKDRKGRTLGLIKVENKKGADERPGDHVLFDAEDAKIAGLLASKVVRLLEQLRSVTLLRDFVQEMRTARNLDRILQTVLTKTQELLYSDRVDLALWSMAKRELIVAATAGAPPTALEKWAVVPVPSIMRSVWDESNTDGRLVHDVRRAADYFPAHPRTQSQVTICLQIDDRPIGVLSAESAQEHGFDEGDLETLRELAPQAALAIQTVGERPHIRGLLRPDVRYSAPSETHLNNVIRSVLDQYQMQSGIIYIADHEHRKLRCLAYVDDRLAEHQKPDQKQFVYEFDDLSAATHILRTKEPVVSLDPRNDASVTFNRAGLDFFRIEGPWVGVPLVHGERVVGVLGVWGLRKAAAIRDLSDSLAPFSRLAAAHIARNVETHPPRPASMLQQWTKTTDELPLAARELCDDMYLRLIAIGVQAAGLERARVYSFDRQKSCFRCVATLGVGQAPVGTEFRGAYAQHLGETFLSNPGARRYDPTDPTMFGPDPYAAEFQKPAELSWAVAPLVVACELEGQIEADNAHVAAEDGRRGAGAADGGEEITPDSLELLTLTASLVSLEMEKRNQRRRQESLEASERLYHEIVDGVDACLFRKDLEGRFILVNDRFCQLMEHSREEIMNKRDVDFFPPETVKLFRERDRRAVEEGISDVVDEVFTGPKTGKKTTLHVKKCRVSDSRGRAIGVQGLCWDVTKQQQQERRLQRLVEKQTSELNQSFKELHHRVKNNLGTIEGFIRLHLAELDNPKALEAMRDLQSRIRTMALVHTQLHQTGARTRLPADAYLSALADLLRRSYVPSAEGITVSVEAESMSLESDMITTCGLIVTELVCNAFKHAFVGRSSGTVAVVLRQDGSMVCLSVVDDGIGMPPEMIRESRGDGLQLVRDWVRDKLDGSIQFVSEGGLGVHIRFSG
jgi:PAS domain S-box-containing protein